MRASLVSRAAKLRAYCARALRSPSCSTEIYVSADALKTEIKFLRIFVYMQALVRAQKVCVCVCAVSAIFSDYNNKMQICRPNYSCS